MTQLDILLAGAFAAFTVDIIIFPLDTLKTRVQSRSWTPDNTTLLNTTKEQPKALFRGLYQGLGVVVLATLPASGAFFISYEQSKQFLSSTPLPTPLAHALASGLAEAVSCAILTPAEVIKQNAQVSSTPTNSISTLRSTANSNLFRGYTALLFRNLPFTALQFPLFEEFRKRLSKRRSAEIEEKEESLTRIGLTAGLAAGCAGSIAAAVTTPLDVIKTRIMLRKKEDGNGNGKGKGRGGGTWTTGKEIVQRNGFRGLWKGGALRSAWTFLGSALYLGFYEGSKVYFSRTRKGEDDSSID